LPLGRGGQTLALLSGGFDSPVAAWHIMRRGTEVELVHFDLGGCGQVDQALKVAQQLTSRWAPGTVVKISVIDLAPLVQALIERCDRRLRQVLLKRAMYRAAARLAQEIGAEALVTGESLAQVSSQTLRSLAVCEAVADLPILRPLIGMDKTEIIARARQIGTYDASEQVEEHCSISGSRVIIWPRRSAVEQAEQAVAEAASEEWAARQVAQRQTINLSEWVPSTALDAATWEVDGVPSLALLVDIRELAEGGDAGDIRLPSSSALDHLERLDLGQEYVLLCQSGQRSRGLASQLRERGYTAWSLRGGVGRLG
ncbi:MAG: tRNA sulfurtransferase, partial [Candidatus Dormibacteraceae bacterium]